MRRTIPARRPFVSDFLKNTPMAKANFVPETARLARAIC
jgi:hypothetical protein